MITTIRNLVVGGVDTMLREHNSKGFTVKTSRNLRFNNGFVTATQPLVTLANLVASSTAQQVSTPINQVII